MENFFKGLHPLTLVGFLMVELTYIIITGYDIHIVPMLVVVIFTNGYIKGIREFLKEIKLTVILVVFFTIFNCIFNHMGERVFLYVNDVPLTIEAVLYGLYMGMVVACLTCWFRLASEILSDGRLMYLLAKPFPTLALIISMIFCYYEKFIGKIDKVREAQYSFNADEGMIKKTGRSFNVLFAVMLEDSVTTAKSMRARAYGRFKRSSYKHYRIKLADAVVFVLTLALAACDIFLGYHDVFRTLVFVLPVVYNIVGEIKWKYYLSKI